MDGRMNCHLTAENAAFTKIRQLEKRMDETDKELDGVEQQVLENTNAFNEHIAQTSERVETKELSATSVTANTANITNAEAGSLNANGITATTIDAETINVDNLENVNVLHGKTVDVDKTIATIESAENVYFSLPVMNTFEPFPIRVKNIFICSQVVF